MKDNIICILSKLSDKLKKEQPRKRGNNGLD